MRLGWPELIIIVAVVLLLFGAAKLPELSRSVGRSLRIFKAETKGLLHDDDKDDASRSSRAPQAIDSAEERAAADRVVPPTGDGAVAAPASERAER